MIKDLSPNEARKRLGSIGRLLYDTRAITLWERDTKLLPWPLRRLRRRYRDFAQRELEPISLKADADPQSVDIKELFLKAAREGFQTEFLPPPIGTANPLALLKSFTMHFALKAEEFCAACAGLGLALLAHDLGIAPLFISGDPKAILKWMKKIYDEIKAGEASIAAFAITEPNAGSDAEDTVGAAYAKAGCKAKKVPGGWRISGRKVFISNGRVAKWVTLFAAIEGEGFESWTCFLLDKSMEGFSVGRSEKKMGQKAADATELILEDIFVPDDRVIGPVRGGWAINRNVLNYSRPVVGAIALGIARGAFERALRFCHEAKLNNKPLVSYQEVQLELADMLLKLFAMRATVWHSMRYRIPFQTAGSIAKVFCSDMAWDVCNQAMALMEDHGFLHCHGVEKAARDARLTQIYEGTNQINRLAIIEGQLNAEFHIPDFYE